MYKIFEKIDCKLVTSKTIGQGAAVGVLDFSARAKTSNPP
jgi:hypothetical protein